MRSTLIDGLSRVLGIVNPTRLTSRGAGSPAGPEEWIAGEAAQLERIREALEARQAWAGSSRTPVSTHQWRIATRRARLCVP